MKKQFFSIVLLLSIGRLTIAAGFLDKPTPIELISQLGQSWTVSTELNSEKGWIEWKHSSGRFGILETGMYSDLGASAVLIGGKPLLVWVSIKTPSADSDVYYAYWEDSSWSQSKMVHQEDSYHDMEPKLYSKNDGGAVLYWYQNTGADVVVKVANFLPDGTLEKDDEKIFSPQVQSPLAEPFDSLDFYQSMNPREENVPLRCIGFGDSITAGQKRNASGQSYFTDGYRNDLDALLTGLEASSDVYKEGLPGDRSYGGVSRIDSIISRHLDANCILIMYGANDRYQGLHPSATAANLKTMAQKARARSVVPVMATITPNTAIGGIGSYNDAARSMFASEGLTYADQYNKMISNGWPHSGDGLHVSDRGDALLAEEWFRAMQTNEWVYPPEKKPVIAPILMLLLL